MKILIIRHADPNYEIDGLTKKGEREALLLSNRLEKENISAFYCSTLGRARLTAKPTLNKIGIDAEYCDWLREFGYAKVKLPYNGEEDSCWDILPEYINTLDNIYSPTDWINAEFIKNTEVPSAYREVCKQLDKLLEKHGYQREGSNYKVNKPNHDTIVLLCHFGLTGVLLSHLLNCSPYSIWQHICTPTTSVTTIYSEEREEGTALFRALSIGDTSHLYSAGEEISFSARFCECFTDDTRHN